MQLMRYTPSSPYECCFLSSADASRPMPFFVLEGRKLIGISVNVCGV
jgi:hypothetical protein